MSDNKNGYEIRQGLLGLAHDIVQQNAHMTFEATKQWPTITTEQVIEEAQKLYEFVQNKG
tara:strand:+ start:394 stop:573 length:180 start_codon:yes stop_codon:yes gene_type:complete